MSDLVTVASFDTEHEAHLLKTRLESENIPAFVQGGHDHYTHILPAHQFKVQVLKSQLEEAQKIMKGSDS